jgi:glycosyltransferase involved in cell wall biosynthesis
VMINDGSTDRTWEKLQAIQERDPHVTVIADMFRNSGQTAAATAGITLASGKHFIFMDSDLQLDPEDLPKLLAPFDAGHAFVTGYRAKRQDPLLRRWPSIIANAIMRRVAQHNLRDFGCTYKIFNGDLIRAFDFGPTKLVNTLFILQRVASATEVPVNHHPRPYNKSGFTPIKLFSHFLDCLAGLRRSFQLVSLMCIGVGTLFVFRILLTLFVDFKFLPAVTPGLLLNAQLIGLLLIIAILAAIGEYCVRIYHRLLGFPEYVLREVRRRPASPQPSE